MNYKIIFFVLFCAIFFPFSAKAVTLYLDPASGQLGPDDAVEVKVKLGVANGECINVANVVLNFPSDVLEVRDFNSGDSIFSLWIDRPNKETMEKSNKSGLIAFSGGLPGGYCGKISGDPGDSNILGSIIFAVKKPILFHKAGIEFSPATEVFLNDGEGTLAKISSQGMNFEISEETPAQPRNDWEKKITEDKIPPEPFVIEISKDEKVSSGRYFIVFSTTDKQTGIDHYEVLETKGRDEAGRDNVLELLKNAFTKKEERARFEIASSPFILKDQTLKSLIKVKAIDRAGNERVIEYRNDGLKIVARKELPWQAIALTSLIFGLAALILTIVVRVIKRRK
jgi:hypothetical protein